MHFYSWHLVAAYVIDILAGDPRALPHPIRWIGRFIARMERIFHDPNAGEGVQRLAGVAFWGVVVGATAAATLLLLRVSWLLHPAAGHLVSIWIVYTTLATRSLHRESEAVAAALRNGDLGVARERLSRIVSRDTAGLSEREIVRALVETVSENISDGIVAPLFYVALGGPVGAMVYKAVNTMDSMVGYLNDRYRHFGWFAARADDAANWIPARLSGVLLTGAAALLKLDAREAWRIMLRDARRMKSPNAGFPEAAAAGALGVKLGGANVYFGEVVEKPTLGEPRSPLTLETYHSMIRLMYTTSALAFCVALAVRVLLF